MAAEKLQELADDTKRTHETRYSPVKHVQSPKDLFSGLNREDAKRKALLALMKSETVRQPNGNALVMLQSFVVGPDGAVHHGKQQALEGDHGVIHEDGVQRSLPLHLASRNLLKVRMLT